MCVQIGNDRMPSLMCGFAIAQDDRRHRDQHQRNASATHPRQMCKKVKAYVHLQRLSVSPPGLRYDPVGERQTLLRVCLDAHKGVTLETYDFRPRSIIGVPFIFAFPPRFNYVMVSFASGWHG